MASSTHSGAKSRLASLPSSRVVSLPDVRSMTETPVPVGNCVWTSPPKASIVPSGEKLEPRRLATGPGTSKHCCSAPSSVTVHSCSITLHHHDPRGRDADDVAVGADGVAEAGRRRTDVDLRAATVTARRRRAGAGGDDRRGQEQNGEAAHGPQRTRGAARRPGTTRARAAMDEPTVDPGRRSGRMVVAESNQTEAPVWTPPAGSDGGVLDLVVVDRRRSAAAGRDRGHRPR